MTHQLKKYLKSRIVYDYESLASAIETGLIPGGGNYEKLQTVYDSLKSGLNNKFPKKYKFFGETLYDAKWLVKNLTLKELDDLFWYALELDGAKKADLENQKSKQEISYKGLFFLLARHYGYDPKTIREMKVCDFNRAVEGMHTNLTLEKTGKIEDIDIEREKLAKELEIINRRKNGDNSSRSSSIN